MPASVDNAIVQIQDAAQAVKNFSALLYDIISFFTRIFGFSAILLLVAVLFTASGIVSVGIPPGRIAFFVSLAFWDCIWMLWLISAGTLNGETLLSCAGVNAKVMAPFAAFDLSRIGIRYALRRMRMYRIRRNGFSADDYCTASKQLACAHAAVQEALLSGIARKKDRIKDPAALYRIKELRRMCDCILEQGSDGESTAFLPEKSNPTNEE